MVIGRIRKRKTQAASNLQGISAEQNAITNGLNKNSLDNVFSQIKKFDDKLTREEFDKQAKANPAAVMAIYESVKPRSIVGSQITLPDGSSATVQGISPYQNANGFFINTDKGQFSAYGKDFIEKGAQYNSDKSFITAVSPAMLEQLEKGAVSLASNKLFTDLPSKNSGGKDLSSEFYIFNDPTVSASLDPWFYDPKSVDDQYEGTYLNNLKLARGENGKLYYAGVSNEGNRTETGFLHGDRAGVTRPFTGSPAQTGFSGSGQTITKKGGFLGSIGSAIGGILDNPIVKLGVSALVPGGAGLVGAFEAGKIGGGLATGQLSFGDAFKGLATAAAAQGVGSLANGFSGAVKDAVGGAAGNIAGAATQGAINGGVGSLLSGGDLGQGLLSGGLFGAGKGAGDALGNSIRDANQPLGTGLTPGAGGQTGLTPPANFDLAPGLGSNLPSTTGYLNFMNGLGGLFDDMRFPAMGLNPGTVGNQDFGSGFGQGLLPPSSPTIPGQLGQGLTVGLPGGTLGQGGFTPTGQINLGDPNSFINAGNQGAGSNPLQNTDFSKLIGGLLGAGAAGGALGGLFGDGQEQPEQQQNLPVQRYQMNPQTFQYNGNTDTYGEVNNDNFRFYKPNLGLLG